MGGWLSKVSFDFSNLKQAMKHGVVISNMVPNIVYGFLIKVYEHINFHNSEFKTMHL